MIRAMKLLGVQGQINMCIQDISYFYAYIFLYHQKNARSNYFYTKKTEPF